MPEHIFFHLVFLSQILLISFYYPRQILSRMSYVFETYPLSTYPKLYPKPIEYYTKAQRNYRIINLFILLAGLLILAVLLGISRSGEWDHAIASWYFVVQIFPMMLLELSSLKEFKLMRNAHSRTTRKAELHPRRLFDFISPSIIGIAIITYVAFVLLVLYIRQFEFPWFGGYWNIVNWLSSLVRKGANWITNYSYSDGGQPFFRRNKFLVHVWKKAKSTPGIPRSNEAYRAHGENIGIHKYCGDHVYSNICGPCCIGFA